MREMANVAWLMILFSFWPASWADDVDPAEKTQQEIQLKISTIHANNGSDCLDPRLSKIKQQLGVDLRYQSNRRSDPSSHPNQFEPRLGFRCRSHRILSVRRHPCRRMDCDFCGCALRLRR